jgi:hypothetical protein
MSSNTPSEPTPALIEVLKALARDWLACYEAADRAQTEWERDHEWVAPLAQNRYPGVDPPRWKQRHEWVGGPLWVDDSEEAQEADDERIGALWDKFLHHRINGLFRVIEEHTGINRDDLDRAAQRINTSLGLVPLRRTRRPRTIPADTNLAGLPDEDERPDLPDLRWVAARLNECDVNGTTARILAAFACRYPEEVSPIPASPEPPAPAVEVLSAMAPPPGHAMTGDERPPMSKEQADAKARELAKELGPKFYLLSKREQAKMIGCHHKTWGGTLFYQTALQEKSRLLPQPATGKSRRRASNLSDKTLASVGREHGELQRLIDEQKADYEPSPLDHDPPDAPRRVRCPKTV